MAQTPMKDMLEKALENFKKALVERDVYYKDHPNLKRAYNGASDFVKFLVNGPSALSPRPPRKPKSN